MNKRTYLCAALVMTALALGFVIFALWNPQISWPWSNAVSYALYAAYVVCMAALYGVALRK